MISSKHISQALYKLSKENIPADKIVSALFWYLEKYQLLGLLPNILDQITVADKKEEIFNSLDIISGLSIDEKIVSQIKETLKIEKETVIQKNTDSGLIGGFIATHKGYIYDASIKQQLNLLRATLNEY